MNHINRRQMLLSAGAVLASVSLAGCPNDEPNDVTPTPTPDPDEPEGRIDAYLTEHDARLYDGTITDLTGEEEITVDVGAGPDGLAYDPAAARIDAGTNVIWEWTGEGGAHNVVSDDDESDFEFSSGDLVDEAGYTWEFTFDDPGVALYYCEAHREVGHLGGIIVE